MKRIIILLSLLLITLGFLSTRSFAQITQQHQLRISVGYIHPEEFYQGIPLTVQFEIENIGDTVFEGKATLEMKTEKYTYTSKEFQISSLDIGGFYTNSNTYLTDDDYGRYRTTLRMESNNIMDKISFYEGTTLKDEGNRVRYETSIFVKSYDIYLREKELEKEERGLETDETMLIVAVVSVAIAFLSYRAIRKRKR